MIYFSGSGLEILIIISNTQWSIHLVGQPTKHVRPVGKSCFQLGHFLLLFLSHNHRGRRHHPIDDILQNIPDGSLDKGDDKALDGVGDGPHQLA